MSNPLRCALYQALDRFRFTRLAARLFYGGVPVRVLRRACAVEGTVETVNGNATDGDATFNITLDDGTSRHCEVTPCAPDAIRRLALTLPIGARVKVSGDERFDPAHVGDGGHVTEGGWLEIHPVTGIEVLRGQDR